MKKIVQFKHFMYGLIALVGLSFYFVGQLAYEPIKGVLSFENAHVDNGYIDLQEYNFIDEKPVRLNGEWTAYKGIYLTDATINYKQLNNNSSQKLPIKSINEDKEDATYQLNIKLDFDENQASDKVIALPFISDDVRVYINGQYIEGKSSREGWNSYFTHHTIYSLDGVYDGNLDAQEIVISTNSSHQKNLFYNKAPSISSLENLLTVEKIIYLIEAVLIGIVIATIFTCISYIVTVPKYTTLTLMNIFDVLLMIHIIFNMSNLPRMLANAVNSTVNIELFIRRMDLTFLFLAGYWGNHLAKALYNKDRSFKSYEKVLNGLYLLLVGYVFISPNMSTIATIYAVILLNLSFILLIKNYIEKIKTSKYKTYQTFHMSKTLYLGCIILIDIVTINSYNRPDNYILMAYGIFFIIHMAIRAYEYRMPYRELAILNHNLEKLVDERTSELIQTNKILMEMAEKDALTKIYNRLYFEENLSSKLELLKTKEIQSLHLCIFDLDNFKSINDTYGHAAGDEQLIGAVQIINEVINKDIIFSRVGGEEFTLIFTDYNDQLVLETVEKVRVALEVQAQQEGRTTGSFGISKAKIDGSRKELFYSSDECLYYSKGNGKNKIFYHFNEDITEYKK